MSTSPTVWIVDDDGASLRALCRLIRAHDFSVTAFSSGAEFLDALDHVHPSCVVLDVQMPGMSGLEVQARLSAVEPTIPVIFVSAFEDSRAEELALSRGAVGFFYKPVRCGALYAAICTGLQRNGPTVIGSDVEE